MLQSETRGVDSAPQLGYAEHFPKESTDRLNGQYARLLNASVDRVIR